MNVYAQVEEKAQPFIEAYHNDLKVHDKGVMQRNPHMPFLHFTHDCGTHLVTLCSFKFYPASREQISFCFGRADRDHILHEKMSIIKHFEQPEYTHPRLILHYDGKAVREVNLAKAREIVTQYQHIMRVTFHKDNGHDPKTVATRNRHSNYDLFPM